GDCWEGYGNCIHFALHYKLDNLLTILLGEEPIGEGDQDWEQLRVFWSLVPVNRLSPLQRALEEENAFGVTLLLNNINLGWALDKD
ncbi:unnamed protein product, partial [Chrysoparadoxa australica]